MSLHHPDTVKMSRVKFRSFLNFERVHSENCKGHFKEDKNYRGTAMIKSWCTTCGAVGFVIRRSEHGQTFEGYLPEKFIGSKKFTESEFRVFPCKQCGETLDVAVNNGKVVCPVCGEQQFKPNQWSSGNKPIISRKI